MKLILIIAIFQQNMHLVSQFQSRDIMGHTVHLVDKCIKCTYESFVNGSAVINRQTDGG